MYTYCISQFFKKLFDFLIYHLVDLTVTRLPPSLKVRQKDGLKTRSKINLVISKTCKSIPISDFVQLSGVPSSSFHRSYAPSLFDLKLIINIDFVSVLRGQNSPQNTLKMHANFLDFIAAFCVLQIRVQNFWDHVTNYILISVGHFVFTCS